MQNNNHKLGDIVLSITVCIQQLLLVMQLLLGENIFWGPEMASRFRLVFSGVSVVFALFWILKRRAFEFILSYISIGILFLFTMIVFPDSTKYIQDEGVKFTCLTCIPIFLSTISIRNLRILKNVFLIVSILTTFIGILYGILILNGLIFQNDYSMSYGYALMLPVMYLFYRRKPIYVLLAVAGLVCVAVNGNRGAFIIILIFLLWFYSKEIVRNKSFSLIFVFGLLFFLYYNLPSILSFLSDNSLHSRTLERMISNQLVESEARENMYIIGISKIWLSPIAGYGLFGDRFFYEIYVHNIVLEIIIDFGIPLGFVLIGYLLYKTILRLRKIKEDERDFFVLITLGSILPLMASSSYLIDFRFFMFLGFLFRKPLNNTIKTQLSYRL